MAENIFNLVKVYTCCCKIFKGLTFSGHSVIIIIIIIIIIEFL